MMHMNFIAVIFFFFAVNLVYSQKKESINITIDPHLTLQNYEHYKRLILNSPDADVEYIDGFDFDWGYTYKLKIKREVLSPILSDGTKYRHQLEKIISKTKVSDTVQFTLSIDPKIYYYQLDPSEEEQNNSLRQLNDSTYLYFNNVEIEVPLFLMEKFYAHSQSSQSKIGTFIYINEKRIRLIKF
jgi:hypothetical protein